MPQTKEEQLREEFAKIFPDPQGRSLFDSQREYIADWWLSKLSSYKSELKERVKLMKKLPPYLGEEPDVTEGFTQAIDRIINLIETK